MEPTDLLLITAFRHPRGEPNAEDGFERFQALTGRVLDETAFRDTVAACVRDGLIRDPVRLEAGALQCHWRLELTPKGVAQARRIAPA